MIRKYLRDEVFVAGGQPSVTYVQREELHVERLLARAIATPNQIVSLSGPTKTGKTVLCRKVLGEREYVWIDGGEIKSDDDFWSRVRIELNLAVTTQTLEGSDSSVNAGMNFVVVTANGSHLMKRSETKTFDSGHLGHIVDHLLTNKIVLVIDDFHYIEKEHRSRIMRNIKGSVFNGLKVVLLSVTHRAFDAIKAESELTGRFTSITLPTWSTSDLSEIPTRGFDALRIALPNDLIATLAKEAQESPFLMQKFCWEICFDFDVESSSLIRKRLDTGDYNLDEMFTRLAQDAGLPIYQKLVAGPQSRKIRSKRPLNSGEEADIYEATLLAIAQTGPKPKISYEELRVSMNNVLSEMMPQKHEITSALKHLAIISKKSGVEDAIDWDEDNREVNVADPYLRFFLRWQVKRRDND